MDSPRDEEREPKGYKICIDDEEQWITVGDRVNDHFRGNGTIAFIGTLQHHDDDSVWFGIELDEPKGLHDGMVEGSQYFECPFQHGIFIQKDQFTAIKYEKKHSVDVDNESVIDSESQIYWFGIVNAVKHELYPLMGIYLAGVVQDLIDKKLLKFSEINANATEQVIGQLQKVRRLNNKEVDIIKDIVNRARCNVPGVSLLCSFIIFAANPCIIHFVDTADVRSNLGFKDFSVKWPGLNEQILFDIFCVKKAYNFSFEQETPYNSKHFVEDVQKAEQYGCLGPIGISEWIQQDAFKRTLEKVSFHPQWLIEDDLFSTMDWIFAVSIFVNQLRMKTSQKQSTRYIHSFIIPESMVSLYDPQNRLLTASLWSSIILELMANIPSIFSMGSTWKCDDFVDVNDSRVVKRAKLIRDLYKEIKYRFKLRDHILILVDLSEETIWMFSVKDLTMFQRLHEEYISFGFEFEISRVVKSWMHFGNSQRVRFYPEYLTTLIPRLFVTPNNMKAATYLKKIFDSSFKHQWAVPLDDATFNLYYKAITGDDHISNNYLRVNVKEDKSMKATLGFWEFLRRRMNQKHFESFHPRLSRDEMDSDAIFDDLLEIENDGRVFVDEDDSNLVTSMKTETVFELKSAAFQWENIECGPSIDKALDLRDCHHLKTVIHYMTIFQDYEHEVDASNLWEFNLGEIIESLDHITSVHELLTPEHRAEIQRYISIHVACDEGSECNVLGKHDSRRREREQLKRSRHSRDQDLVIDRTDLDFDRIERECIVMNDALCSLHSLLLHRDYSLGSGGRPARFRNEATDDSEQKEDEATEIEPITDEPNAIDFGVSVLRWLAFGERPHFTSFREEITGNSESTITDEIFERFLIECSEKIRNTTFTLKEMMALKLFTDCTKFQSYLRKAHWVSTPLSIKKMFYFWGSALYEAALYHSEPIPTTDGRSPIALYHGVNKLFTVDAEIPKYHGPFSSTTAKSVAHQFTNDQGLYFKMQPSYANKLKCCVGTKVESISCFKQEQEILLVDQFLPMSSAKTFENTDSAQVNYLIFSVKGWKLEIRDKDQFFKQLGICFDAQWMALIGESSQLFVRSEFEGRMVITRLAVELDLYSTDWISFPLDGNIIGVHDLELLLGAHKDVSRLLPLYRVLTSKFRVKQSVRLNLCLKIEFVPNTNMNDLADGGDSCFEKTEYEIDGVRVPYTVSSFDGVIRRITCRNTSLFGDHVVWTQEFQATQNQNEFLAEVIDLVENHKVHQLLPHYRVLTSKFHVVQSHLVNQCFKIEFLPNTKMDHIEKSIDASCFEETEYQINGVPVPHSISLVKETIRRISCRNKKLFGDIVVWTQEFVPPQDQNELIVQEVVDLVENHSVHQLLPHYRVFTSKFQVVQSLHLNLCVKIELIPNTKMDHIAAKDVDDSLFEETEYRINGVLVPYSASTFKEVVRQIRCRNTVLFGNRDVWIQSFDDFWDANVREPTNEEITSFIEEHNVRRLLAHYRVLTSKFRVIQSHLVNRCFKIEFIPNTKMDHIEDTIQYMDTQMQDDFGTDESCFDQTEYTIYYTNTHNEDDFGYDEQAVEGVSVPYNIHSVDGPIDRISCRNPDLFGARDLWTQEFPAPHDPQGLLDEVIDLVENHKVHQLLPHYRVLTSKFRVVQNDKMDGSFDVECIRNTKMDHIDDEKNIDFTEYFTEYRFDVEQLVPDTISYFTSDHSGVIREICCRNTHLFEVFGGQDIGIQKLGLGDNWTRKLGFDWRHKMNLEVHKHNGHLQDDHPENLLDGDQKTHYVGNCGIAEYWLEIANTVKQTVDSKIDGMIAKLQKGSPLSNKEVDMIAKLQKDGRLNKKEVDIIEGIVRTDGLIAKLQEGSPLNNEEVDMIEKLQKDGRLNNKEVDLIKGNVRTDGMIAKLQKGSRLNNKEIDFIKGIVRTDEVIQVIAKLQKGSPLNDEEVDIIKGIVRTDEVNQVNQVIAKLQKQSRLNNEEVDIIKGIVRTDEANQVIADLQEESLLNNKEVDIIKGLVQNVQQQVDEVEFSHPVQRELVTMGFDREYVVRSTNLYRKKFKNKPLRREVLTEIIIRLQQRDRNRQHHAKSMVRGSLASEKELRAQMQGHEKRRSRHSEPDWIIFKYKGKKNIFPGKIMIRNSDHRFDNAIKSIAISWSEDDHEYHDLITLDCIKRDSKERQYFDLDKDAAYWRNRDLNFIQINILENYGNTETNSFIEFAVVGFEDRGHIAADGVKLL